MLDEIKGVLEAQLSIKDGTLVPFNGESDHVHLLLEMPMVHSLSMAVNNFKSVRLVAQAAASAGRDVPQARALEAATPSAAWTE